MLNLRPIYTPQKSLPIPAEIEKPTSLEGFKGDKKLKKRAEDLAWQMNFAKMKLNHWHDLDNLDWAKLEGLFEEARTGFEDLNQA